jgi:hypothetical protein
MLGCVTRAAHEQQQRKKRDTDMHESIIVVHAKLVEPDSRNKH